MAQKNKSPQQDPGISEQEARVRFERMQRARQALGQLDPSHEAQMRTKAEEAQQREQESLQRAEAMARLRKRMRARETEVEPAPPKPAASDRVPIEEEIVVANRLYGEALKHARRFLDNVRAGKPVDYHEAEPTVDGFIGSIFRNESAAAALCKLRHADEYTYTHGINVSVLAIILGKHLNLTPEELRLVGIAGVFHDVGKALVPESILNKPGRLSDEEMDIMRTHAQKGYDVLSLQQDMPPEVMNAALEHHERCDGSGYPKGIRSTETHIISRVIGLVDVYDALTSRRPYKDALPPGKVMGMMYQWRLSDFQPHIVEHFIKSLGIYPVGSFVRLTDGRHGVVVGHHADAPLRPVVKVAFDLAMQPITPRVVDLVEQAAGQNGKQLLIADIVNPQESGVDVAKLMR
ncbi:HD-GYP domain-containing protein [Salidesulfovibrio onnuriiensis]|uniref:HD-GYP domain-containing protein n=1 Tax=Salidesulfovibrio onnuriiensis TaxID=2583823 RepID=UPI0011CCA8FD|nr:HD domain-containing phosphohydrolase [Salidesulfovibrio onnuriiensis]